MSLLGAELCQSWEVEGCLLVQPHGDPKSFPGPRLASQCRPPGEGVVKVQSQGNIYKLYIYIKCAIYNIL